MQDTSILGGIKYAHIPSPGEMQDAALERQIKQQRLQAGELEIQAHKDAVAKEQRATADTASVNDAYRTAFKTDASTGVVSLDRDYLTQTLAQKNLGSHVPTILKSLSDMDEATAKARKTLQEAEKDANDVKGSAAAGIQAANYSPDAFGLAVTHLALNKTIDPGEAHRLLATVGSDPAKIKGQVEEWLKGSPTQQERATQALSAGTTARRLDLETPEMLAKGQIATQVAAGTKGGLTPEQQAQQAQQTTTHAEAARHNRVDEGLSAGRLAVERQRLGAETMSPAGAAVPDVEPGKKNDAFLATLATPVASQVKAIAEGRMQVPAGAALRSPYWQNMLQAVAKYDPTFDAVNYNARAKTRAAFTAGKEAGQVNALNTVIGHLDGLSEAADALHNSDSPMFNSIANRVSKAMGRPVVTNFDTIKKAVADEVTKVWRQTGGTEADIQAAQANLDAAGSPAQLHGAIATYGELLESKLASLKDQYRQGMGTDPIGMITPPARAALDKMEQRAGHKPAAASGPLRRPIPGLPGAEAESTDGGKTWKRVK